MGTPVVLAPMAGITNAAYRRLCREQGAGLYVCEMITSRGIVERDETTLRMLTFDETEDVRSVQLYGTDPVYVGKAAEILCAEHGVAHIDLNFGCPVPKVTRKGGGGALPWKRRLLGEILEARGPGGRAVRRPGDHEDPQGHRRRPPDLPRRRPDRAGGRLRRDRAARPHRRPGLLRAGRLVRDRGAGRARRHPGARQRRHLGGRGRGRGWSSRPVPPASSSGAAAWAGPGCSATWRRRSRASRSPRCRRSARWPR